jgi:hypothetical protein
MRAMPESDPSANPLAPKVHRRCAYALEAWPLRRRMAVAVVAPLLLVLMVAASGGWAVVTSPGWTALVALVAVACAATLATYIPRPGTGRRLELGCSPCAVVAALSVLVSFGVLNSAPHDVSTALLALGISAIGLVQRMKNPSTCPA